MAVTICMNPHAAGFDPNTSAHTEAEWAAHTAAAHEVSYVGAVLKTGEHNWHDDSDFFAMVWDAAEGKVKEVDCGTTRGWTYHDGAKVDATVEARVQAVLWETERLVRLWTEDLLAAIEMDTVVRSTTTRGKNKGLVGTVAWIGTDAYQSSRYATVRRFGLKVEGQSGLVYLSEDKVARVVTELTATEQAGLRARARRRANETYGNPVV